MATRWGITPENARWWAVAAACFGLGMAMLDTTVVITALPTIRQDLHMSLSGLLWTVSAYTLAHAVLLVTGGRLGDIYGRRRVYLIGLSIFAVASAGAGAAPNEGLLFAGRAVQGVGAALMMPSTLAIITNVFPPKERARAIGIWAGVSGIALAVGPAVGGLLTSEVSWRAIFFLNLPIGAVAIVVTLVAVPEFSNPKAVHKLDVPGVLVLSAAMTALVLAVIQSTEWGWTSVRILGLLGGAAVGVVVFVLVERAAPSPVLKLELLHSRPLVASVVAALSLSMGLIAMLFYMTIYLQSVLGYGVLETGLRLVPGTIMVALVSPRSGALQQRMPVRYVIAGGLVTVAVGLAVVTRLTVDSSYTTVLVALVILGVGVGIVTPAMSSSAMSSIHPKDAGSASSMVSMGRQLGFALGVAIVGTVFKSLARTRASQSLTALGLPRSASRGLVDAAGAGHVPSLPQGGPPGVVHALRDAVAHGVANAMYVPMTILLVGTVVVLLLTAGSSAPAPSGGAPGH